MIYLDNASTKKLCDDAKNELLALLDEYGNPSSSHTLGVSAHRRIELCKSGIRSLIGADEGDTVVFTSGGSESNNLALGTAKAIGIAKNKKRIVISAIEHDSVYAPAMEMQKDGFEIVTVNPDESGVVSPASIAQAIDESTVMVSVMTVNNELGTVQPIQKIGQICRERGVLFHTDAVASVGHIKTDVARDNVDMLSLSAHKFGGLKGVGALYCKKGVSVAPMILGGNQQDGLRAGTENLHGICTMYTALKSASDSIDKNRKSVQALRQMLLRGIESNGFCVINGKSDDSFPYTVNFSLRGINSEAVLLMLDESGICASIGAACHSHERSPSRTLLAIGRANELAVDRIRFSLSEDNTSDEISYVIEQLTRIINTLK